MEPDVALVLGSIFGVLAIPTIMSAISDRRAPGVSVILVLFSGALLFYANQNHPGGYSLQDVPVVFVRLFKQLFS